MLYIYLDSHQIKLLHLKKSLLGQYDVSFYSKTFDVELIQNGLPGNIDVIDSAVKKTLEEIPEQPLKDKDITLILPLSAFSFFRAELPVDVTPSVLESYIKEKAKTTLNMEIDSMHFDYLIQESEGQKQVLFFGIKNETFEAFQQPFKLLDLKVTSIIPESLTYYKLFEKTLRKNKKENIWYVSYENDILHGYVYDSFGLLEGEKWVANLTKDKKVETVLQKKAAEYQAKEIKLNRLILSGKQADGIRQDTFTKNVGVWTNPLIRIIPHFYADYLKMLQHDTKPLPILQYDMLIGGFIFSQENKTFTLLGKSSPEQHIPVTSSPLSDKKFPIRNIALFLISFVATFGILYGLSQLIPQFKWDGFKAFKLPSFNNVSVPGVAKATPTPVLEPTVAPPTPTPTPSITREEIRVKVLNGSGIAGKASDVKEFFTEKGYGEILTANADAFDFETTVVQIREEDTEIRAFVEEDIASQVESPEFETLDEDEAADVVVIVGTDFK